MSSSAHSVTINSGPPRLELRGLRKAFDGVHAVNDLSLEVWPGEIHAIVGENGAGKSTVMNMISGVLAPDSGEIHIDGKPAALNSPRQAQERGVGTVFQELSLVPALSIAENIYSNRTPTAALGFVRWRELHSRAERLLEELGASVDVRRTVASIDAGTRQLVEIAKALSLNANLLLLDEPTSALTPHEVEMLFALLRRLRTTGISIIYVSHQMREVLAIADRITVMRDGRKIGTWRSEQTTAGEIVRHMVGREILERNNAAAAVLGPQRLAAEALTVAGHFHDVSLSMRAGETVGLAGLMGSGRSELARALCGARPIDSGRILVDHQAVAFRSVGDAVRSGIAYVPGERKTEGLFLTKSLADNIAAPSLARLSRYGLIDRSARDRQAMRAIRMLQIRCTGPQQQAKRLSGGNQQKVVFGKWLLTEPRILIVDEPTKGVDVGVKNEIHAELRRLARGGTALLIVSSDLPELLLLCDRILVMRHGRVAADIPHGEATEELVMSRAAGLDPAAQVAS
jgi:ribose transport system ATP-binding protein